jgi:hypothetical protein
MSAEGGKVWTPPKHSNIILPFNIKRILKSTNKKEGAGIE